MTSLSSKSSDLAIVVRPAVGDKNNLTRTTVAEVNAELLEDKMGIQDQLQRNMGRYSSILVAIACQNSWGASAGSYQLSLESGGVPVIIWGTFAYFPFAMGMALSLGELASAFPSAAGPSHFVACLGAPSRSRIYSFLVGSFNTAGLWAGIASFLSIGQNIVLGMILRDRPPTNWESCVTMLVLQFITVGISVLGRKALPAITMASMIWIVGSLVVVVAIILGKTDGNFNTYDEVFVFTNPTGWSDGMASAIGMLVPAYAYAAQDMALHLQEEMINPGMDVPLAMIALTCSSLVFSLFYYFPLFFSIPDLETASSSTFIIQAVYEQLGRSRAMGNLLSAILLIGIAATLVGVQFSSGRMTWAYARDGGFPFQEYLSEVSPTLGYPFRAQLLANFVVSLLALLYIASPTAFNSIISSSLAFVDLVFLASFVLLILNRHKMDKESRGVFWLGNWGYVANALAIFGCVFTIVFVSFPVFKSTTANTMNYNVVLVAGWAAFTTGWWFIGGRKRYTAPKFNLHTSLL